MTSSDTLKALAVRNSTPSWAQWFVNVVGQRRMQAGMSAHFEFSDYYRASHPIWKTLALARWERHPVQRWRNAPSLRARAVASQEGL